MKDALAAKYGILNGPVRLKQRQYYLNTLAFGFALSSLSSCDDVFRSSFFPSFDSLPSLSLYNHPPHQDYFQLPFFSSVKPFSMNQRQVLIKEAFFASNGNVHGIRVFPTFNY